jgi:hypothetical protein
MRNVTRKHSVKGMVKRVPQFKRSCMVNISPGLQEATNLLMNEVVGILLPIYLFPNKGSKNGNKIRIINQPPWTTLFGYMEKGQKNFNFSDLFHYGCNSCHDMSFSEYLIYYHTA